MWLGRGFGLALGVRLGLALGWVGVVTGVVKVEVGSGGEVARAGVIRRWLGWDGVAWGVGGVGWSGACSVFCCLLLFFLFLYVAVVGVVVVCCMWLVLMVVCLSCVCFAGFVEICLFVDIFGFALLLLLLLLFCCGCSCFVIWQFNFVWAD